MFYTKFDHQGLMLRNLSTSAYYMYLVHPPILITISLIFSSITLIPIIKVTLVFILTVLMCYLTSHYLIEKIHYKKNYDSPPVF